MIPRLPAGAARRDGIVLLLALLCLIAIEVTAVGVHFVALQELRTARAVGRTTQLRLAAQAAASRTIAAWPVGAIGGLGTGDTMSVPAADGFAPGGIRFGAILERVGPDLFLVRGEARSPLQENTSIGALIALAPPERMAGAVRAALVTNGSVILRPGGSIAVGVGCDDGTPAAAAVMLAAPDALQITGGTLAGAVRDGGADVSVERIGLLTKTVIERVATSISAGVVTPRPVSAPDGCATGISDNWGNPTDRASACAPYFPILYRSGDLTLNGGEGQGILAVDGNVTLVGSRFDGILIVRGTLRLTAGASLNGAVVVETGPVDVEGSSIIFSRCAVTDAFRDIRVRGPFRPAGRMWIPLF